MQDLNMQPVGPEYATVSRRPLDIEDYIDIVRRHKAWILGPAFAALVLSVVVAFLWPDTYVSVATIRVVPPQVPEELVPTNVNSAMSQRINSMYQTISSRGALTNMVNVYNLYPRDRNRKPMEDIVETVRRNIRISDVMPSRQSAGSVNREVPAFQISFSYENRVVAQKVTADLVSRFITENARERATQSVLTTQFLKDQVEAARQQLEALDGKLANYRQSYQGRLPEQLTQNTMQLNMLEQRVANLNAALGRIAQEKMLLEADLRSLKTQKATMAPAPEQAEVRQRNQRLDQMDGDILKLETLLAALRERFTDKHPDVQRVAAQLKIQKNMRDKVAREEEQQTEEAPAIRRQDPLFEREARSIDSNMERIEAQLKAKAAEAEGYQKDIASTERQIRSVQTRIEAAPVSEQQYAELIRDQQLAKSKYEEMMRKQSMSSVAEELEKRQQGETLELLDPASLPQSPTEPKRIVIVAAGTVFGLFVGLMFAGAREARDTSLKNLKDVRAYTQLPVLGSVPLLENDLVVRRRKRLTWLAWSTACLVGILIMTGSVFYYYATRV
jgi:polysaccharide chain length determinant protein (PEP-CTERM system associated)